MKKTIRRGRKGLAFIMCVLMMLSTLVFAVPTSASAAYTADPTPENYRVIAYVTQWNWPGTDDPMIEGDAVANIDASKITHINYAFGHVVNAQAASYSSGFTGCVDVPDPDKLRALVKLKEQNPDLKVLISFGGWGMDGFCPISGNATLRQNFVKSCVEIMKTYGLDGIDIDYEYPGTSADQYDPLVCTHAMSGGGANETTAYVDGEGALQLFKDFRNYEEFGWDYLLTIASGVGYDWMCAMPTGDIPNYLDFINIMCYDLYGNWTDHSEFNANLYPSTTNNLSYDVVCTRLKYRGYPADIMNIGIPIYGRDRKFKPANSETSSAAGLGDNSWLTYDQIADLLDKGLTRTLDPQTKASIASGTVDGRTYEITYDDVEDIQLKTQWIQDEGFGGGMYWEYSQDSKHGSPLTQAVWDGLNGSGRKKNPPTPSPRYVNTTSYPEWKSYKMLDENASPCWYNGKLYEFANASYAGYHQGTYGWCPTFAPEHALDGTAYADLVSRCKAGNASSYGAEWKVVEDLTATNAVARGEAKKTPGKVDTTGLRIDSATPSTQYALPGSTITWNINVKGGSGSYNITNQVWFLGQKYGTQAADGSWPGNADGYSKIEKRRTGGPYPLPSQGKYVGETRDLVNCTNASTTAASHQVSATFPVEGDYMIFTQVTDSTGMMAAQYSQTVSITTDMPALTASVVLDKTGTILAGTTVTATVSTQSETPITSYKYDVYNGNTVISSETTTSSTYSFVPTTAGTYKVAVTASNAAGSATATSATVNVFQPLDITSLTTSGSVTTGKTVTYTCTAVGGAGGNQYSYYLIKDGKIWASVAYTSDATFTFTATEAGTYSLRAYCQDITGTRVFEVATVNVA